MTPAMRAVVEHFRDLGPRWGLQADTAAAHALLYLLGRPVTGTEIAACLGLDAARAEAAIADLLGWRMATRLADGRVTTSGQPWDLLVAAVQERQRREIEPALRVLADAARSAGADGTPPQTARRIEALAALVRDISAIGARLSRLPSGGLSRMTTIAGRLSRLLPGSRG